MTDTFINYICTFIGINIGRFLNWTIQGFGFTVGAWLFLKLIGIAP